MSFQPSAFQLDAFQWAANNVQRSGVIRLWVTQLTAEMNGMADGDSPKQEKRVNADTSKEKIIFVPMGEKPKVKLKKPEVKDDYEPLRVVALPLRAAALPSPVETAGFLLQGITGHIRKQLWTAQDVLKLLNDKLRKAEEDEETMLLEQAAALLF